MDGTQQGENVLCHPTHGNERQLGGHHIWCPYMDCSIRDKAQLIMACDHAGALPETL